MRRRYYCEIVSDSLEHISPSVSMLFEELESRGQHPSTVLDIGCGNGRNSIALAKKYNSEVTLVEPDGSMLDWARKYFALQGTSEPAIIQETIEQTMREASTWSDKKYDIVILSYVLQHIDPAHYPVIFEFLRERCGGYLAIDVFWNPSRCGPGQTITIGSTVWHGIRYEELVNIIAPRFDIIRQKVYVNDVSVIINLVARQGITPQERIITREYNYYLGSLRIRCKGLSQRLSRRPIKQTKIDELPSFVLLSSIYPGQMDLVRMQMTEWLQGAENHRREVGAAKYLYLCRANKVPLLLREASRDFGISPGGVMRGIASTDYIPPLELPNYIERLVAQLELDDVLKQRAILFGSKKNLGGFSPAVRAGCAVLLAAKQLGIELKVVDVARSMGVSKIALNISLAKSFGSRISE